MYKRKPNIYSVKDSYKLHRTLTKRPLTSVLYCKIAHTFMKFIMTKIFDGEIVRLPANMGSIGVRGQRLTPTIGEDGYVKGLPIDWGQTRKLWERCLECKEKKQLVFHFNEHSNGVMYKIFWSTKDVILSNKSAYSLNFFKRTSKGGKLAKRIREGQEYYVYT